MTARGVDIAFVVMAHRSPAQTARLCRRLSSPASAVVLHLDSATDADTEADLRDRLPAGVEWAPRHRSAWASIGIVEGVLAGVRTCLERTTARHVVVLSGSDYPLVSMPQLVDFFRGHPAESFVASWALPSRLWGPDGGMSRITRWNRPVAGRRVQIPLRRRYPAGFRPVGGSMWVALERRAAEHLIEVTERRPDVLRFHRRTWIPDELYVPTVLLNSDLASTVRNENLWQIYWPGGAHPRTLTVADADELLRVARGEGVQSGGSSRAKLFARKFDEQVDSAVLDALDTSLDDT